MRYTEKQLKHRLALVQDDLKAIIEFIEAKGLNKTFAQPTEFAGECWSHISNIEIACDLSNEEPNTWKLYHNA